eukprot:TRINITY_DN7952_c0_g1_i4.p1 TRINITY_DN7952_c0_g1~~TRINITY_DN7952_c0_g1_i4.p1  ORF type:complete len:220 (-),score=50.78 TRINITY_DN7952_c0_g1_i4:120-779(-)
MVVTIGLSLAGIGVLLQPADPEKTPFLLTSSATIPLVSDSAFTGTTRLVIGILVTMLATLLYSLEYVLAEQMLHNHEDPHRMNAGLLCGYVGASGSFLLFLYIIFWTIPHWSELVSIEIAKHHGKVPTIVLLYFVFLVSEAAFNLLYFMIVEQAGALSAGVMQGLKAVLVFSLSSIFFCQYQSSQCFDGFKGLSTLVVLGGVFTYAYLAYQDVKNINDD